MAPSNLTKVKLIPALLVYKRVLHQHYLRGKTYSVLTLDYRLQCMLLVLKFNSFCNRLLLDKDTVFFSTK